MPAKEVDPFEESRSLAALLARDYARDFLILLIKYRDISASEAATRLNIHIKTAQDFLEGLNEAGILARREAEEGKRPYFRYSLSKKNINISFNLDSLYDPGAHASRAAEKIREQKNSGALFKTGRDERISAFHIFEGSGRSRRERRFNLTGSQGRFLFHLPFPTETAMPVRDIIKKAGLEINCLPEILDLVDILQAGAVIKTEE